MAIGNERSAIPVKLTVASSTLTVVLDQQPIPGRFDVCLVAYLWAATTVIGRGENSGHILNEFNIVRSFSQLETWDGSPHTFSVALPSLPADASKVAVLIQEANQGPITGAASVNIR